MQGEIRIHKASSELSQAIDEAVALFGEAGLWLPGLDIHAQCDKSTCSGAPGLFNKKGAAHRVDIHTNQLSVVIHELAHAWGTPQRQGCNQRSIHGVRRCDITE